METGIRVNEKNQVVLCGDRICCPVMEKLADGRYRIIDDDGNSCIVTAEQVALMEKGMKKCDDLHVTTEQLICG